MNLNQLLSLVETSGKNTAITIPGIWIGKANKKVALGYSEFLAAQIRTILASPQNIEPAKGSHWTNDAVVYNLFVRLFTAYDHDQDGQIGDSPNDMTLNAAGVRETGTFMKTIALLPYLKSLGINTIHLLPITTIGIEGRKGDLGSPYAIKNPFKLDPLLADPMVPLSVDDQYKAFVAAAHYVGIRVVQEFIFRTGAMDSDWILEHPEWFYWIKDKEKYGPPQFTPGQLEQLLKIPKGKGTFIPPSVAYRNSFSVPPLPGKRGNLAIASAFADWPPNDLQPPWSDVTYLRLYNFDYNAESNFNYIAYNTIRFYDPALAIKENRNMEVWEKIASIIPWFQNGFGIDGAMIDMGHALPPELKSKIIKNAREVNPDFGFWDENFSNTISTKKEGYNAVIGGAWHLITKRNGFKKLIQGATKKTALPFFGTSETHNTPRFGFGSVQKKKAAWLLFNLLPNAIPFLHNGFELNESLPVNTGLNFTKKQIDHYTQQPLPLFYKNRLDWDIKNIVPFITALSIIRSNQPWIFNSSDPSILMTSTPSVMAFWIKAEGNEALALFNLDFFSRKQFTIDKACRDNYINLLTAEAIDLAIPIELKAGEVFLGLRK